MKYSLWMVATAGLAVASTVAPCQSFAEEVRKAPASAQAKPSQQDLAEEIGSLRNARVAIPTDGGKVEVTYFASSLSDSEVKKLKELAPNVRIVTGLNAAAALARAGEAHGIDARYATPEFLAKADKLVWIQVPSAGVERFATMEPLASNDKIVLTNFRGVHGPTIADHSMAMLLAVTRELPITAAPDARRGSGRRKEAGPGPIALEGKTMLVVGLGGIGTEIAQRAHGFGMRVIGTRRSDSPSPDYIAKVGKPQDLLSMLPEADVVAIAVPLTPETENLFNAEAFAAMKPNSYLINIARGKIVDTNALLQALESGKLAGAGLDVTDPEPLPQDHPLRKFTNVVVTPHVAGHSQVTRERGAALLQENLRRFGAGEPLLNVVDKKAGY
ncbi:D-2-hydroxyacid dehydrogenase [Planctomicrobium sp. SH664]|uniref:D-2-hydroxyacid dehydrogenase n=1 Tax=Planctomicrobium sp. SH664 TaxID=3448125 RepID=UPI003F5AF6E3